jgi:hypothetical protein
MTARQKYSQAVKNHNAARSKRRRAYWNHQADHQANRVARTYQTAIAKAW